MWLGMDAAPVIQTGHHVRVKQDSALSETRNSVSRLFKRKRWQSFQLTCQSQQMWEGCWSPEVAVKMFACIVDTRVLQQRDVCVQSLQAVDCLMLIVDCWLLIVDTRVLQQRDVCVQSLQTQCHPITKQSQRRPFRMHLAKFMACQNANITTACKNNLGTPGW